MKNRISTTILLLLVYVSVVCAQGISVSAPSSVATGENFRIAYTITNSDVDDFRAGNIPQGLEVIAGPYTSQQSSYQNYNGHVTRTSSVTYTYTIYAEKAGTYTLPAAHAKVGEKTIASRPMRISVSGSAHSNGSAAPKMHEDDADMRGAGSKISGNDLFVRVSASKKRVHEQEPILLTYKVYTLVDLTSLDVKMPDLKGFHTQEITLPQPRSFHIEKLNGRNYRCVTWSQYVMYPQMTGKMTIPSITFKGIVVQQNRSVDPFEAFFNGGSGYVEVKRNIVAPSVDIQVDPLPNKPADFSGGVGKFSISAQLLKQDVKAGVPLTLRVVVGGMGNLKLIKQPIVVFPKDFDKYDPKVSDKTKLTTNGIEGNMVYDFLAVPRNQGKYTIPAVTLTYFDTAENAYKTVRTQPIIVNVEKGDGKGGSVVDYSEEKAVDIKPIKDGGYSIVDVNNIFFGSVGYCLWIILPLVAFVVLIIVFRKKAAENADIVGKKGRRANKVATKRLRNAYKLMCAGKQNDFYDEVLRALWGYVGDKMNMPVEKLSRENISEQFAICGIGNDIVEKFMTALDECEYERYAPGSAEGNMTKTYDCAMVAIMEIEKSLKSSKAKSHTNTTLVLFFVLSMGWLCGQTTFAANVSQQAMKESADALYAKGNYQQASTYYTELLKKGESAELYYNLGNCQYRLGNITQSIIAYERALRLNPGDGDTKYNLTFLRGKTIDKIVPVDDMFFVAWYDSVMNMMSINTWSYIAIISFIVALALLLGYLFSVKLWMRKTGFYGGVALLVVFVLCNLFAFQRKQRLSQHNIAIVTTSTLSIKKTPADSGEEAYVIHEGSRVTITDRTMKDWYGVRLDDGKEGWLKKRSVEVI